MLKLLYTIFDLLRIFFYAKKKKERLPISKTELRILGNGKSLNEQCFDESSNFDYFVVNRHVLCDNYSIIKPHYYALADPFFLNNPDGLDVISQIINKTSWEMYLFLPHYGSIKKTKRWIETSNCNIKVISYNPYDFRGYEKIAYFLYNHQLAMPKVQNVLVAAIMLGIYMGYAKIELYGVEHSWTKYLSVGDDNLVYLYNPHSYDKEMVKPRPFREIQHVKFYPMWLVLQNYMYMFKSYSIISDYIRKKHISTNIVNKTPHSFIDAFERAE